MPSLHGFCVPAGCLLAWWWHVWHGWHTSWCLQTGQPSKPHLPPAGPWRRWTLEAQVSLEVLGDLTDQALEGQLADQELSSSSGSDGSHGEPRYRGGTWWGFLTPPVAGADLRAALVASCFLGAFPPVDLRAVCLVRAIFQRCLLYQWQRKNEVQFWRSGTISRPPLHWVDACESLIGWNPTHELRCELKCSANPFLSVSRPFLHVNCFAYVRRRPLKLGLKIDYLPFC